jgi:hypothetical protein
VDWAIVVTGVVGLAGIGGTLLSARMTGKSDAENLRASISAEDQRVKLAEKRRIYASCIAALTVGLNAARAILPGETGPADERHDELMAQWGSAVATAISAASEVRLVGPFVVADLATRLVNLLIRARRVDDLGEWGRIYTELVAAMRADLGEAD